MINGDAAVQEKIKSAAESFSGEKTDGVVWSEILAPVAAEKGFDITFDDYKAYVDGLNKSHELSMEEMENVAGGIFTFCIIIGGSSEKVAQADPEGGVGACYYVGVGIIGKND